MFGVEDHTDTLGVEIPVEPVSHLLGQTLLHLETPREVLDHSSEFGQPKDPVTGKVTDVGYPLEGEEVMLT